MFLGPGWGASTYDGARPWVNTRGFSRFWGDGVRWDEVVSSGDGDRGRVLYVRVQVDTRNSKTNPGWLSDSLGLSALSAGWLTLMSSRASKTGRKKFESRLSVQNFGANSCSLHLPSTHVRIESQRLIGAEAPLDGRPLVLCSGRFLPRIVLFWVRALG